MVEIRAGSGGGGRTTSLPSTRLKWARPAPRVLVTADGPASSFDPKTLQALRSEGFQISYLHYDGDRKAFGNNLFKVAEPLGLGDYWAILAYGRAAAAALDVCMKPISKLSALVAYYPTAFPNTKTGLPPNLETVIHLGGEQKLTASPGPRYSYPQARSGFAETDASSYDAVAADLAWTRTLTVLRRAFGNEADIESIWEKYLAASFVNHDVDAILSTLSSEATVTFTPVSMGGTGHAALRTFYTDHFVKQLPPSLKTRLLSRTIGFDRLVDEMFVAFTHDRAMAWMLPGVEPTNQAVEVALVLVVGIRANHIYSMHAYWDQATVLKQVGLLDGKEKSAASDNKGRGGKEGKKGKKGKNAEDASNPKQQQQQQQKQQQQKQQQQKQQQLPVLGREAARKVMNTKGTPTNPLLSTG